VKDRIIPPQFALSNHTIKKNPFIMATIEEYKEDLRKFHLEDASLLDQYQFIQTLQQMENY